MPVEDPHRIHCRLDELLAERGLTLTALAEQDRGDHRQPQRPEEPARQAVRFSTLTAICDGSTASPGDLFVLD